MLARFFNSDIYARIYKNRIALRLIQKNRNLEAVSEKPFTTHRLLVGEFSNAEQLLTRLVKELNGSNWFALSPSILVHPLEMVDGGLSQVEERVFLELGLGARARAAKVYVGPELTDQAVISKLRER